MGDKPAVRAALAGASICGDQANVRRVAAVLHPRKPSAPATTCWGPCARSARPIALASAVIGSRNLGANWTPNIRAIAQANRIELVPTLAYAGNLNRIESHFRAIPKVRLQQTDYPGWDTARRAVDDYITHRKGTDRDRRISALERKHQIAA